MAGTKHCFRCKKDKPLGDFYNNKCCKDGKNPYCKLCFDEKKREYPGATKGSIRNSHLKQKYGINSKIYDQLLKEQEGVCKICGDINGNDRPLNVDHDHLTGEIRGLLCLCCNMGIGLMKDSPQNLRKAAVYLEGGEDF